MSTLPTELRTGTQAQRGLLQKREEIVIDAEGRTAWLALSSETPVERAWGIEVLDHSDRSIRMDRLRNGGAVLADHDHRDIVGVIEQVRLDADRVARALVRFGRGARASEVFQDVVDGIRRHVSIGYQIYGAVRESEHDGVGTYRITDWEPYEASIVSIPADPRVGVGRSAASAEPEAPAPAEAETETPPAEEARADETTEPPEPEAPATPEVKIMSENTATLDAERKRAADIIAIGRQFARHGLDKEAMEFVASGKSVEEFRQLALETVAARPLPNAEIGLSDKEARQFSFMRAIRALSAKGSDAVRAREEAAFEFEVSEATAKRLGRDARGILVPYDVQVRDLEVTTANSSTGGQLVATNLLASNFIDLLRNRMSVMRAGAQMLTGLVGNIAMPRQTGAATAYWVAESGAPTESQAALDQVSMSPKTVGAFTDISRKLLLQSSLDVEALVRRDIASSLGLAIDLAALNGSGSSNQPRGVLQTSGIGSVVGGTNGAAPTWAHIVELWSDVAVANADFGTTAYLTNAKVAGRLMTTEKASGTAQFVCPGFPDANGIATFGGARAVISNQVPSNLTKGSASGVASAILFGNFADLIVGMWGGLDLTVDTAALATSGGVRVIGLQDVDVAVRQVASFSAMLDALTA
jgi:HK97 family phage major capsid protein